MRKIWLFVLGLALGFAGACVIRALCPFLGDSTSIKTKVDTLYLNCTTRVNTPVIYETRITDTMVVEVTDYVVVHDTAFVTLPKEEVEYRDSSYRAVVSGWRPRLEELEIYQREKIVTIQTEKYVPVPEARRWGLGVQAGYGITPRGFQPYLGVGLSYNFARF